MVYWILTKSAKTPQWGKISLSTNDSGTSEYLHTRMKLDHFLRLYTKMNKKYILNPNVRIYIIKIFEENIVVNLCDFRLVKALLDKIKTKATKKKD